MRSNNLTILLHNFNPRSHERSDESDVYLPLFLEISIHAPTRGATIYKELFDRLAIFQSTLPREERQSNSFIILSLLIISIHAPTRGATCLPGYNSPCWIISIHAPTRGATILIGVEVFSMLFQSTLPREERRIRVIHYQVTARFQSTLPREERQQYCTKNLFIFIQYRQ